MPATLEAPNIEPSALAGKLRKRRPGRRLLIFLGVLSLTGGLLAETSRVLLGRNFHTVVPGKVYRGAQPSPEDLNALVPQYQLRTVVNLRGSCDPYEWYVKECRATQHLQVAQEDICFSSGRLPSDHEVRRLVDVLDHADYPLYLHCRRGADRTGLASAIYLLLFTDVTLAEGCRQLGIRYGHMAVGRPAFLDEFFDFYRAWLAERHQDHDRALFRHWLLRAYRGGGNNYQIEKVACATGEPRQGQPTAFLVRVRNTGINTWHMRPGPTSGVQLGYHVRDEKDRLAASGYWGNFQAEVGPGQAIDVTFVMPSLPRSGRYRLLVDMVDPHQGWFFQTGAEPFEEELSVRE